MKFPGGGKSGRDFKVSNMAGDRGCGSSTSDGMVEIGRAFTIAETSAKSVTSSS